MTPFQWQLLTSKYKWPVWRDVVCFYKLSQYCPARKSEKTESFNHDIQCPRLSHTVVSGFTVNKHSTDSLPRVWLFSLAASQHTISKNIKEVITLRLRN
jgi:hypothetical protein